MYSKVVYFGVMVVLVGVNIHVLFRMLFKEPLINSKQQNEHTKNSDFYLLARFMALVPMFENA